jgi:hypothetical protein
VVFDPGVTVTSLVNIFNAIRPDIFAGTLRAISLLASLLGDVAAMIDALQGQRSVFTFDAYDKLVAFYLAVANMRFGLNRGALPTATFVADRQTTLDAVARRFGNTLRQVMGLNLNLLRRPVVERGTPVTYFLVT